ncbi:class I SAM-dependent methyltransferase [Acinetobacter sp. S40]|uniref:class I SAM-dependent methyltransferase n=1 Tax=Acinetobacter sp. S40 TaxID=2767434 RepID=UPI00190D8C24|nr:class I SAM-dependent methyltransferase [Acinetobacter sp. S40]MBJ9984044.1 class I SAM-dependent methyltransferase [Acinetobacter sp. S40]
MKDLFSAQSQLYQQARPSYPQAVIQELLKHVPSQEFAWDCGAGSGQLTQLLAPYFDQIVATDLSANQLQHAPYFENVSYQVQAAEKSDFPAQCFDLIAVAQAIHWFEFDAFYTQVKRTLKPDGLFAVLGYGLIQVDHAELNEAIQYLYRVILKDYWDVERHYIDERYQTIPFPFKEIAMPDFKIELKWTFQQLIDYLNTWSAVKHYLNKNQQNPLQLILESKQLEPQINVSFPILLRVGRL